MTRDQASTLAYTVLREHGLMDWKVRLTTQLQYLGKYHYDTKTIFLNTHQIDTHPDVEVENTIRHEVAHALTPDHGHDDVWADKARELGCSNTAVCGPPLDARAIDAIRSGAIVEVEYDEEIIRKPRYKITRLQDKCSQCGKVAEEVSRSEFLGSILIKLKCGHIIMKELPKATPYHEMVSLTGELNEDGTPICPVNGSVKDHQWDHTTCKKCGAHRLYKYQVQGALFLERAFGRAGIFDEMGLGKTIQVLAYLKYHPEAFPVLFIVKSSIKYQWLSEIVKWLGYDYFAQVIQSSKQSPIPGLKSYIVSYDLLRRYDISKFKTIAKIKTIVIDECQQIKNVDSSRTKMVRQLVKEVTGFVPLSGTPWKNRGSEYFPVLNMLDPIRFPSNEKFVNQWCDFYYDGPKLKMGGIREVKKFKEYVKDIVLRRQQHEVDAEFPDLKRVKFNTQLNELEREVYDQEESEFVQWYNQMVLGGEEDKMWQPGEDNALAKLTRLRHLVGLAKIPATIELAEEYMESVENGKMVVFVHHQDVGRIIAQRLRSNEVTKHFPIFTYTSDLSPEARFELQTKFNETKQCIMVASSLAAGEGLNLQTCNYMILHERQWNPQNEEQVEKRFVRIGAVHNKVTATYAHAQDSIDTKFDSLVERKRQFFHQAMNNNEMMVWDEKSITKELVQSIVDDYNRRKKAS
jgi:SNF2 family DNA or RNA helicase